MKIVWITSTTGRAYVDGNLIAYAHKKEDGTVYYDSIF